MGIARWTGAAGDYITSVEVLARIAELLAAPVQRHHVEGLIEELVALFEITPRAKNSDFR